MYFKRAFFFLTTLCLFSCAVPPKGAVYAGNTEIIFKSTVAFVNGVEVDDDDADDADEDALIPTAGSTDDAKPEKPKKTTYFPYCTGVWVSQDLILSANHCAAGLNFMNKLVKLTPKERFIAVMTGSIKPNKYATMDTEMSYSVHSEINDLKSKPKYIHKSKVVAVDVEHDLMLVKVEGLTMPRHSIAPLAKKTPNIGDEIQTVGHPGQLYYTLTKGYVAGYRSGEGLSSKKGTKGPFIQVTGPIWKGNSGGGFFNMDGELVGIVDFLAGGPNQSFGIHLTVLKDFVNANKTKVFK